MRAWRVEQQRYYREEEEIKAGISRLSRLLRTNAMTMLHGARGRCLAEWQHATHRAHLQHQKEVVAMKIHQRELSTATQRVARTMEELRKGIVGRIIVAWSRNRLAELAAFHEQELAARVQGSAVAMLKSVAREQIQGVIGVSADMCACHCSVPDH